MKKYLYTIITLFAAFLTSCSIQESETTIKTNAEEPEFYASIEDASTRVFADENLSVLWNADDRVSIFNKNTYNQQYKFLGETGDNAGGFNKVDVTENVTGKPITNVVSVYPYQEDTKISEDGVLTVTLPAEQTYSENSFGRGTNMMVSVSSDNFLEYNNVGGYLKLSLYGYDVSVSSVTLKGNNGEKIAGKALVTMPLDGVPSVEMTNDATNEISIICDTPIKLSSKAEERVDFWFVVPPVTFSKGFTIYVKETSGGIYEKTTLNSITIERSRLLKMSPLKVQQMVIPNNTIYYTSLDDKVVVPYKEDAFGANIVSNEYSDGQGIISFDKDLTSIGNQAFYQCSNLSSITIPESIEIIGQEAFYSCSNLTFINIPDNITSIENNTFTFCTGLSSITIPNNVTKIGSAAFSRTGLRSLSIPKSVTSIGNSAFSSCEKIEAIIVEPGNPKFNSEGNCNAIIETDSKVLVLGCKNTVIPKNITCIGEGAFSGCRGLSSIAIPENVEIIGTEAFLDCSNLSSIIIPDRVTTLGRQAFSNCSKLQSIIIPESVSSVGYGCFIRCSSLGEIRCLPGTPPSGGSYMFDYTYCPIYVPEESVDAYKARSYWSGYKSRIQAFPSSPIHITGISLDKTSLSIPVGRTKSITATVLPEDATNKTVFWTSSNTDIATVDFGKITALKEGNCTISIRAYDGDLTAECQVTVVPKSDPSFYSSTDFSRDGEVVLLQQATVGRGINIILLGDGFVDTDMVPEGNYEQKAKQAMEQFFSYEPYRTFRNRFNFYCVKVVSVNKEYGSEQSDRAITYEQDRMIYFRTSLCYKYAGTVPNPNNQPLKVAVLFNTTRSVARSFCYMTLGSGEALAFLMDPEKNLINHELGGHGFAFLADEYEEYSGTFTGQSSLDQDYSRYGFGANVDWRNDVSTVRWSAFLSDSRYSAEGLGIYEGAYLYPRGIYRSTPNSVMRNHYLSTGKSYNAPSREQIYKTIMRYSEGNSWSYDYETFVVADAAGREQAVSVFNPSSASAPLRSRQKDYSDNHMPPIITDHQVDEICIDKDGNVIFVK